MDVQWFRKVGTRAAQAISKVVMAGVGGERPRVAVGSVAPTVLRCTKTEARARRGERRSKTQSRMLEEEVQPIDDLRSTATYRRRVCGNLLRRFGSDTTR